MFDGWGYAHLYREQRRQDGSGRLQAVEEALNEKYSFGFGDLSIHEHATDPTENVAYSSLLRGAA